MTSAPSSTTPARNEAAVGWTATMGLIPGYGHDNRPDEIADRRNVLVALWTEAMENTLSATGFSVSTVMSESTVIYPKAGGCPEGGEIAMTLTGSSNPTYVPPERFDAFMEAVRATVHRVQVGMEQTSCRIEFRRIDRSIYSRLDRD